MDIEEYCIQKNVPLGAIDGYVKAKGWTDVLSDEQVTELDKYLFPSSLALPGETPKMSTYEKGQAMAETLNIKFVSYEQLDSVLKQIGFSYRDVIDLYQREKRDDIVEYFNQKEQETANFLGTAFERAEREAIYRIIDNLQPGTINYLKSQGQTPYEYFKVPEPVR
jgi:hypothetical protein